MLEVESIKQPEAVQTANPRRVLLVGCAIGAAAIALAAFGIADRARSRQELTSWTDEQAVPTVRLVEAPTRSERGAAGSSRQCQRFLHGFYLRPRQRLCHRLVQGHRRPCEEGGDARGDRGAGSRSAARAGEGATCPAEGGGPAGAGERLLGRVTDQRTSRLVAQGWTSEQQGDTDRLTLASRTAALEVARANVEAQQAAVSRLEELRSSSRSRRRSMASSRRVRSISGISSTPAAKSGKPLFQVSDIHEMRVYVNVPQAYLSDMKPGLEAGLELPGVDKTFPGEARFDFERNRRELANRFGGAAGGQSRWPIVARRFH